MKSSAWELTGSSGIKGFYPETLNFYRKDDNFTEKVRRLYSKESKINIKEIKNLNKSAHFTGKKTTTQGLVNTIYLSSMILTIPVIYDKKV